MVFSEASAWAAVIPGFRRATVNVFRNRRSLKLSFTNPARTWPYMLAGTQTWSAGPMVNVPFKPLGATPMTVNGVALKVTALLIMLRSEPNLLVQRL